MSPFIKKFKPYARHMFIFPVLLCICQGDLKAQEKELWFGTYTDEDNRVYQGRYHIVKEGRALTEIVLAPYGKRPIPFKIVKNDTVQGFVEVTWPDRPNRIATLLRYNDGYYAGNFEEGTKTLPIVLKEFNFQDAQLQGNWFKPSMVEVEIIENAARLLHSTDQWNKNDTRICESTATYSLFCALYESSITIDGEYRHLRPAIKFVRDAIQEKYPKKYDHVLVDFNNAKEITLKELHEILELAKNNLIRTIE